MQEAVLETQEEFEAIQHPQAQTAPLAVVRENPKPLTAEEVLWQVGQIQTIMQGVMKKDVDYGMVPGCKSPTLLKPGSEILLTTFHIASKPVIHDLSTPDKVHYRVISYGYYRDGSLVGTGVGECSSNEEKYKWRRAVCDQEWNETPADRRREKWHKGWDGKPDWKSKQVRTENADLANTVLKMAKKRSQVDLTLTCTAASRLFTQDVEDLPPEYLNQHGSEPAGAKGTTGTASTTARGNLSEKQVGRFLAIFTAAKKNGATDEVAKAILDSIVPNNRTADGKFDWNKVSKVQYDTICNHFEKGTWKQAYEEIMKADSSIPDGVDLDELPGME